MLQSRLLAILEAENLATDDRSKGYNRYQISMIALLFYSPTLAIAA